MEAKLYSAGTPQRDSLCSYAEQLPAVELNATFHRLPSEEQPRRWAEQTPPGSRFAVKMNRCLSHFGDVALAGAFCERVRALGNRLGPVLVQLPPSRPRGDGWLELLLGSLDPGLDVAVEPRNKTRAGAKSVQAVNALESGAPFRHLRLREPPYDEAALAWGGNRLRPLLERGVDVYAFFKHEHEPLAPRYAQRLLQLVSSSCA